MSEWMPIAATWVCLSIGLAILLIAHCAIWWYALGLIRKCAYETYLLADMRRWMKERNFEKGSKNHEDST